MARNEGTPAADFSSSIAGLTAESREDFDAWAKSNDQKAKRYRQAKEMNLRVLEAMASDGAGDSSVPLLGIRWFNPHLALARSSFKLQGQRRIAYALNGTLWHPPKGI